MSIAADIQTKMNEAIAAQEAGDFATAIAKARSASMLMAAIPDTTSTGDGLHWSRESIAAVIAELKRAKGGAVGVGFTNVIYKRPALDDDDCRR